MPAEERRSLRREYRIRAAIIFCFAVSVAFVVGIGALFPAFARAAADRHDAATALAAIQADNSASGLTDIQSRVAAYSQMVTALRGSVGTVKDSALVAGVVGARGSVSVTSLSVSRSDSKVSITIQGVAPTRDDLLAFKARLAAAVPGSTVDLPISELAKSSDVSFSVQVTQPLP